MLVKPIDSLVVEDPENENVAYSPQGHRRGSTVGCDAWECRVPRVQALESLGSSRSKLRARRNDLYIPGRARRGSHQAEQVTPRPLRNVP